jgi:hypothetical protein
MILVSIDARKVGTSSSHLRVMVRKEREGAIEGWGWGRVYAFPLDTA